VGALPGGIRTRSRRAGADLLRTLGHLVLPSPSFFEGPQVFHEPAELLKETFLVLNRSPPARGKKGFVDTANALFYAVLYIAMTNTFHYSKTTGIKL
jgi:hypothetical protein